MADPGRAPGGEAEGGERRPGRELSPPWERPPLGKPPPGMPPPGPGEAAARVREAAGRDPLAADLRCSLFAAALQSYKRDSALRPFPGRYAGGDSKDFEGLVSASGPGPAGCIRTGSTVFCPRREKTASRKGWVEGGAPAEPGWAAGGEAGEGALRVRAAAARGEG